MKTASLAAACLLASTPAIADWALDADASTLTFTSTKATVAAEVHTFGTLAGAVDSHGRATLEVRLDSVDTTIEIRDERMRELLFETGQYPLATVQLKLDPALIDDLAIGASATVAAEAELSLHGTLSPLTVALTVAKLTDQRLLVTSDKPVIVNASAVGLELGLEKLREIAGLPSISPAVPVTFLLYFDAG